MPALRPAAHAKPVDEKITINVGFVDLGQIDLLVQEGFYANRSDLIRTAIRNQISAHADTLRQAVNRRTLVLGIQHLAARDLEAVRARGETLDVRVLGLLTIAADVTPELALQTLRSVVVLGSLHATSGDELGTFGLGLTGVMAHCRRGRCPRLHPLAGPARPFSRWTAFVHPLGW